MKGVVIVEAIRQDMYIRDIIENYPETKDIFIQNGLNDNILNKLGPFLRLNTALKGKNINTEIFIKLLEEKINEQITKKSNSQDSLKVFALLPCPVKVAIEDSFKKYLEELGEKEKLKIDYVIEGNANNQLSYDKFVEQYEDIDDVPDIVISSGINSFFYKKFVGKFVDKGLFIDTAQYLPDERLTKVGIKDAEGNYTILFMNLLVMVVDLTRIGDLPLPKRWEDLLKPEYNKKVVIRGQKGKFCETTLLTIYKEYGYDGIKELGKSVMAGWHPSEMVKAAGRNKEGAPAISVMPYFYSKTIINQDNVKVIWPEEGAIVSPVTMLVKKSKLEISKKISDFFTGASVGEICASVDFPTLNPAVDNKLPENAAFNWIGWDFIKHNDVGSIIKEVDKLFLQSFCE